MCRECGGDPAALGRATAAASQPPTTASHPSHPSFPQADAPNESKLRALPGTGAWTGALIAALLDLRLKLAVPAITAGVFLAGIIISLLTYGAAALL